MRLARKIERYYYYISIATGGRPFRGRKKCWKLPHFCAENKSLLVFLRRITKPHTNSESALTRSEAEIQDRAVKEQDKKKIKCEGRDFHAST